MGGMYERMLGLAPKVVNYCTIPGQLPSYLMVLTYIVQAHPAYLSVRATEHLLQVDKSFFFYV